MGVVLQRVQDGQASIQGGEQITPEEHDAVKQECVEPCQLAIFVKILIFQALPREDEAINANNYARGCVGARKRLENGPRLPNGFHEACVFDRRLDDHDEDDATREHADRAQRQ